MKEQGEHDPLVVFVLGHRLPRGDRGDARVRRDRGVSVRIVAAHKIERLGCVNSPYVNRKKPGHATIWAKSTVHPCMAG